MGNEFNNERISNYMSSNSIKIDNSFNELLDINVINTTQIKNIDDFINNIENNIDFILSNPEKIQENKKSEINWLLYLLENKISKLNELRCIDEIYRNREDLISYISNSDYKSKDYHYVHKENIWKFKWYDYDKKNKKWADDYITSIERVKYNKNIDLENSEKYLNLFNEIWLSNNIFRIKYYIEKYYQVKNDNIKNLIISNIENNISSLQNIFKALERKIYLININIIDINAINTAFNIIIDDLVKLCKYDYDEIKELRNLLIDLLQSFQFVLSNKQKEILNNQMINEIINKISSIDKNLIKQNKKLNDINNNLIQHNEKLDEKNDILNHINFNLNYIWELASYSRKEYYLIGRSWYESTRASVGRSPKRLLESNSNSFSTPGIISNWWRRWSNQEVNSFYMM